MRSETGRLLFAGLFKALQQPFRAPCLAMATATVLAMAAHAAPPPAAGEPAPDPELLSVDGAKKSATNLSREEIGTRSLHGQELYSRNCFVCHQINGLGIPGVFPPLAKSDFLAADLARSIRATCEGLVGEITVNKKRYAGAMPPVMLEDAEIADIFTYVLNSWGNPGGVVNADDVKKIRSRTAFPTLEALKQSSVYPTVPKAPPGLAVREIIRLPFKGVRMTSDGQGKVMYILAENGDVWRLAIETAQLKQIQWGPRYLEKRPKDLGGPLFVLGMAMDREKRLYIASNQQNGETKPNQNIVTIYRSTSVLDGDPSDLKPWFQTNYPGSPAYIHAVENIGFGPDGLLYVGNGARTDGGQTGPTGEWYGGGETPITACMWRLDPKVEKPTLEVYARGLRNAYGFTWNDQGEMFATENGPDADAPEELNQIQQGHHYGFPYTFADWGKRKAYDHTQDPPPGLEFTLPIPNIGPDGGFDGKPMYTFDPHSGPGGIVFLRDDFPEPYRGTFFLTRFGNFIRTPKDNVGFDVLQARLKKGAKGTYEAEIHTLLPHLGRPIDIHQSGRGKLYICEYSRGTTSAASYALSGRILELSAP
jgi:glucose/arabinose dehydrogenase